MSSPPIQIRTSPSTGSTGVRPIRLHAAPRGDNDRIRAEVAGRIFYFGNASDTPEIAHAKRLCNSAYVAKISDDYTAFVDDAKNYYNTVFVVGTDPARVRKFLRTYRPLFMRKAKIALVKESRPRSRAQMLNTGFDDVFDLETHPLEASVRLDAILGRVAHSHAAETFDDVLKTHMRFYADTKLLEREVRILALLIANRGMPVRKHLLTASTKSPHKSITPKSLQVLISGLRGKLKPNFRIVSHGASGYSFEEVSAVAERLATATRAETH